MRTIKKRKRFITFFYTAIVIVLSMFLFITLIGSIIRYNINLKEVNRLKSEYEELKFEYDKKLELYNTLKKLNEGSDSKQ
ncbi:MAG: hypothetical protein H0Z24_01340 [Thermosipho sp. (in: Bacteria)]|nr:hypothetical protein [Thermosipho sp. (in: thermotogales)]